MTSARGVPVVLRVPRWSAHNSTGAFRFHQLAVFALSGGCPGDSSGGSVYRSATPGNIIELYATGLTAQPGGLIPSAQGISGVTVTIGTVTVPADYAGQTPDVGEFQINSTVPQQFANIAGGKLSDLDRVERRGLHPGSALGNASVQKWTFETCPVWGGKSQGSNEPL